MKENLRKYIKNKNKVVLDSEPNFESVFNIIHNQDDRIFCEYMEKFKIHEVLYKEFKSYVFKLANYYENNIVISKHQFVGIYMENSCDWVASFWALLSIGYKPLLMNCKLPSNINNDVLKMANCNFIIATDNFNVDAFKCEKLIVPFKIGIRQEIENLEEIKNFDWENEIALSTTATTLNIKLCIYTGSNILEQIKNTSGILSQNKMVKAHYKGRLKHLAFLPFYHIFGLVAVYFWFSLYGRTFVFLNDYSSDTILKTVRKHEVTHIFAVPLLWNSLTREIKKEVTLQDVKVQKKFEKGLKLCSMIQNIAPVKGLKLTNKLMNEIHSKTFGNSIKFMISGGSYISDETLQLINGLGYPLYCGYGTTEIGITSVELRSKLKYRNLGTVGKPFSSVSYKIKDNILYVKGKSTCSKIISKDSIKEVSENDWYCTNDIFDVDKNNHYLIQGRQDDLFIGTNGEKINPDLVEKELNFKNIEKYCVLPIQVNNKNILSLVIEVKPNLNKLLVNKVVQEVKDNLEHLEQLNIHIEQVYFSNSPICNPNAIKISRKALTLMIEKGLVKLIPLKEFVSMVDKPVEVLSKETCEDVKKVMTNILGIDSSKIEDTSHFIFDLGGSSLDYCSLLIELEKIYQIQFDFKETSCSSALEFSNFIVSKLK